MHDKSIEIEAKRLEKLKDYLEAAELYQMAGKYKKAIKLFLKENAYHRAGEVYLELEKYKKAAEMFEQAGDYERAAAAYRSLSNRDKEKEMLLKLAKMYRDNNKPILAAETYEQLGKHDLAVDLLLSGNLVERAIRVLERAGNHEKARTLEQRLATSELEDKPGSNQPVTYKESGVDIDVYNKVLDRIKPMIKTTFTPAVASEIGSFGGIYKVEPGSETERFLVSSVDSVGTKLKVAFMANIHDTVGIDIVSHCANDILVQGAEPMFFMDYIGIGKMDSVVIEDLIKGLSEGCRSIGCALLGGEIAELPGMYNPGEYDLVGFIVGMVDKNQLIDGSSITPGDACIGLMSSGLHTNGYSLVRKLIFGKARLGIKDIIPGVNKPVYEGLLTPHKSYVASITKLRKSVTVKGLAHITGGGITDNLPRILPEGTHAKIKIDSWPANPMFTYLQELGNIPEKEMFHTFNMGIGMIVIVPEKQASKTIKILESHGEEAYLVGTIEPKGTGVEYA